MKGTYDTAETETNMTCFSKEEIGCQKFSAAPEQRILFWIS